MKEAENAAKPMNGEQVVGYRELTQAEIDMMNELKRISAMFLARLDVVANAHEIKGNQLRWLAIARTDMQTACMAACRAVANPSEAC